MLPHQMKLKQSDVFVYIRQRLHKFHFQSDAGWYGDFSSPVLDAVSMKTTLHAKALVKSLLRPCPNLARSTIVVPIFLRQYPIPLSQKD
jgi:hypothetical protein